MYRKFRFAILTHAAVGFCQSQKLRIGCHTEKAINQIISGDLDIWKRVVAELCGDQIAEDMDFDSIFIRIWTDEGFLIGDFEVTKKFTPEFEAKEIVDEN